MAKESEILKLPKAPLQEVIFEVRWELDISQETNQLYDSNFDTAVGLMRLNVKTEFPVYKQKFPPGLQFPIGFLSYQTMYQYWSGENKWPVLQLGPGIFTVNDTEANYEWFNNYYPLIKKALSWLKESYNQELKFNFVSLRYIDRISTKDYHFSDWLNFIRENLNFELKNEFDTLGKLKQFNFNQIFELEDGSELQITISNGKSNNLDDILVWETAVIKMSTFDDIGLKEWLDQSHNTTSNLFKEICKYELYNSFQ